MNLNGKLAEMHFTMWLLRKGYDVFWPVDASSPADVVWRAAPGSAWRSAQVKKVYEKAEGKWPRWTISSTVNITKREGDTYDATEVDYFAFVDYENCQLWLVKSTMPHRGRPIHTYTRVRLTDEWDKYRSSL